MKNSPELTPAYEPKPEEGLEQGKEKEIELKIETLDDFFDSMKYSYDLAEDAETKQHLAHQMLKLNSALNSAGLEAGDIKVEDTPEGVLGLYYPGTGNIALSKDMIDDFESSQKLVAHVLVHERSHSEGIADEGMAEIITNRKLPPLLSFYVREQELVKSTFHRLGTEKTISLYDINQPEKLVDAFMEVEMIHRKKANSNIDSKVEAGKLEKFIKQSLPRLYDRLKSKSYDFKKVTKTALEKEQ